MSHSILEKIHFIKTGKTYHRLVINSIIYVSTEGNYSTFFIDENKYLAKISLKQAQKIISDDNFIQIHRNYLVQLDKITRIDTHNNKVIINKTILPIGKSFKKKLMDKIIIIC